MRHSFVVAVVVAIMLVCSQAAYCAAVSATETTISIPTYEYEEGLFTPLPKDRLPGYPYPNLRQQDVAKTPTPHDYRAIILENDYVKITLLPDLGCRLHKMIYKPTGQSVFYENEPLKPNPFCEQGWWVSTGGVEWCFPLTEHSTNVLRPWDYVVKRAADGSASVVFADEHQRTGLAGSFSLTLKPNSCSFGLDVRLSNPGFAEKSFMYWSNAMFPAHDGVEFVVPTKWMSYEWDTFSWPIKDGKDLSRFDNWPSYDSKFAAKLYAGFDGIYDHTRDLGMVRTFPLGVARGAKIFSYGHTDAVYLQPHRYTDTGKAYFELMGGYTPSFWTEETIAPRQVIEWHEDWYPIAATDGFNAASGDVAVKHEIKQVGKFSREVKLTVFPSRDIPNARISVYAGAKVLTGWKQDLKCGKAATLTASIQSEPDYAYCRVDAGGKNLLRFNLEEPVAVKPEKQPDPLPHYYSSKPETVVGFLNCDQLAEAIKLFEQNPTGGPEVATACGVALMRTGRTDDALQWLLKCRHSGSVPGYLAASIMLRRGDMKSARMALESAVKADRRDMRALGALATVENRLGNTKGAKELFAKVLLQLPTDLLANAEMAGLGDADCAMRLDGFLSYTAQDAINLAIEYINLGDFAKARQYADKASKQEPNNVMPYAVQLVAASAMKDSAGVEAAARGVQSVDVENALVYGGDNATAILEEAQRIKPESSRLMLYLATAYQVRNSRSSAAAMAEAAANAEPTLARAYLIQAQSQYVYSDSEMEYLTMAKKAAELYDKCLALNPANPAYYYTAAWDYGDSGRSRAVVAAMKRAVELDPNCYTAYFVLGRDALNERHDYAEAAKWFKLEANSPDHQSGEREVLSAYMKWMQSLLREQNYTKLAEVLAEAETVPAREPSMEASFVRSDVLATLGRQEDARKVLEDMKTAKEDMLKNGWMRDWYYIGCAMEKLGEKDEALTLWNKCRTELETTVKKYPDWDYGVYLLAITLDKLDQPREAIDRISSLKRKFRTNVDYQYAYQDIRARSEAVKAEK